MEDCFLLCLPVPLQWLDLAVDHELGTFPQKPVGCRMLHHWAFLSVLSVPMPCLWAADW